VNECIVVKIGNVGHIGQGGQLLDMAETHLEHVFGTVLQQKGKSGFIAIGNTGLADCQRDTSHRQVKRFQHPVGGPVIRELLRDQHGDSAELMEKCIRRLLIVRAPVPVPPRLELIGVGGRL